MPQLPSPARDAWEKVAEGRIRASFGRGDETANPNAKRRRLSGRRRCSSDGSQLGQCAIGSRHNVPIARSHYWLMARKYLEKKDARRVEMADTDT
jgi:hypothetical protein